MYLNHFYRSGNFSYSRFIYQEGPREITHGINVAPPNQEKLKAETENRKKEQDRAIKGLDRDLKETGLTRRDLNPDVITLMGRPDGQPDARHAEWEKKIDAFLKTKDGELKYLEYRIRAVIAEEFKATQETSHSDNSAVVNIPLFEREIKELLDAEKDPSKHAALEAKTDRLLLQLYTAGLDQLTWQNKLRGADPKVPNQLLFDMRFSDSIQELEGKLQKLKEDVK